MLLAFSSNRGGGSDGSDDVDGDGSEGGDRRRLEINGESGRDFRVAHIPQAREATKAKKK